MSDLTKHYIFCMTPGRTGTHYLTALLGANLPEAEVCHEIVGFDRFGVDAPEISHLTLFNSVGNVSAVSAFWEQKLARIRRKRLRYYAETSHVLMKAGLVENLDVLADAGLVHFICLTRDIAKTLLSYRRTALFSNRIMWWAQFLDPAYPRKIVNPRAISLKGHDGLCLWYVFEIMARTEYYKIVMRDRPWIRFHNVSIEQLNSRAGVARLLGELDLERADEEIVIPPPQSVSAESTRNAAEERLVRDLRRAIEQLDFDPKKIAEAFIRGGRTL